MQRRVVRFVALLTAAAYARVMNKLLLPTPLDSVFACIAWLTRRPQQVASTRSRLRLCAAYLQYIQIGADANALIVLVVVVVISSRNFRARALCMRGAAAAIGRSCARGRRYASAGISRLDSSQISCV